jgi:phytoene synthase
LSAKMSDINWSELDELVARGDPDRYVASLFASPARRRGLIALYAFNHEVARIREIVHEPLVGHIRLGWWREQIAAIYEQRALTAPLTLALGETVEAFALPRALFDAYLDARGLDFEEAPFADEGALEGYAAATAGSLMQLAARVCGADNRADAAAREAGVAVAYAGFIRSLAFDAAHRRCRLPLKWLEAEGLNAEDVFAAKMTPALRRVVARLAEVARAHLRATRKVGLPTAAIAALAPAALVPAYLRRAARNDVLSKTLLIAQHERVARIAFAVLTWRI